MTGIVRPRSKSIVDTDGRLTLEWDAFFSVLLNALNAVSEAGLPRAPSFTVATVPDATIPGRIIFVSNEAGGAVLAFSDGTNWRRVTDRAVIS